MQTRIETGKEIWDSFVPTVEWFLRHDRSKYTIDGVEVSGYRSPDTEPIWLRDHTHQMKGFRYFERDMTSALNVFKKHQMPDGAFYDFFHTADNGEVSQPSDDTRVPDRYDFDSASGIVFARCGVEADVEYLAVESVYRAWQSTGDDNWMAGMLDALDRGLTYSLTSPGRWSKEYGLVKRGFTLDTWDFEYIPTVLVDDHYEYAPPTPGYPPDGHYWCIMHGDNTGMANSCMLLARLYEYTGDSERASKWWERSEYLTRKTNEVCWNGKFYTHQVHITPVEVATDEKQQISLSNSYSLNRCVPDHEQCVSIIREYQRRREAHPDHFAEWYSIDPPFNNLVFMKEYPHGTYVNGGIMPLVGGEIARAAFEHGFESYGVDILKRYYELAIKPKETYLWYFPDGTHWTGGSFLPTDGWGSAAMLNALMEGLAGIEDTSKLFQTVRLSPRWPSTGESSANVAAAYPASGASFSYSYKLNSNEIEIATEGSGTNCAHHVLLPEGKQVADVTADGSSRRFSVSKIEQSVYADFLAPIGATSIVRLI